MAEILIVRESCKQNAHKPETLFENKENKIFQDTEIQRHYTIQDIRPNLVSVCSM